MSEAVRERAVLDLALKRFRVVADQPDAVRAPRTEMIGVTDVREQT